MKLTLSHPEYDELKKLAERLMALRGTLDEGAWKKPQHKVIREFSKKFSKEAGLGTELTVPIKRQHLRIIQEAFTQGCELLTRQIIPGYEKKVAVASTEDERKALAMYLQRASARANAMQAVLTKAEACL